MKKSLSALLTLVALTAVTSLGQPPAPVPPTAATLAPISPMGVQRGTTLDLVLTGTNLQDPVGLLTSFPAKVSIPTENNNGKAPTTFKVKLEVPKDAPMGFHSIRVATKKGITNARLFCVDDLPEVAEIATNRDLKTAQPIVAPCVVNARADVEVTDFFKVSVKAKQRLSFEVIGRRLGSAFDPQITLLDASGRELPGAYSNDAPGLQTDCRITHTFDKDGDAFVAVRDVSYRGGADFHYRLRVGDFPCATTPLPLAVKRGGKASVTFAGPQVEGVAAVEVTPPTDPALDAMQVAPKGSNGLFGWPVLLHVSAIDESLEKEPNDDPKQATRLAVPGAITGRFEKKDDVDHFVFKAEKGKQLTVEVHASEHLSPTEVLVTIKNDKGAQVLASNAMSAPKLNFNPPTDGDYTVVVEHLHSWGGPDEVYRMTVTPTTTSFGLSLNVDRWDVSPGATFSMPIFVQQAGYTGPIEVSVTGLKGLSGTVTIPAGAKQPIQPAGTLVVKADESLAPGAYAFQIQGKAKIDGKDVVVYASWRNLLSVAMGGLTVPPRPMFSQLGLVVTDKPPFSVVLKFEGPGVAPGAAIDCTVSIVRDKGFDAEVVVALQGLPPGVKTEPAAPKIAAKENAVKVKLTTPANAKLMPYPVSVTGTAKHGGRDWIVRGGPAQMVLKK